MSDLVQRLRGIYPNNHRVEPNGLELEAANRIEALEAALRDIASGNVPIIGIDGASLVEDSYREFALRVLEGK